MDALDPSERKKIIEIMKEKERNVPNMDWMYTKQKPDRDEYLLGKKVDKTFETGDKPEETIPQAEIFGERIKANITLDMQAKMREDPLFAIKKVEEESRRKLLQNPIKMKQLKKMIEQQKREKKKKKKKHKHRKGDSDSEDDLVSKYLSILNKKQNTKRGLSSDGEKHSSKEKSHKVSKHDRGDGSSKKDDSHSRKDDSHSRKDNSKNQRTDNSKNGHSRTRTLSNRSSDGDRFEDSYRSRSKEKHKLEDNTEKNEERHKVPSPVHHRRRYDSSSSEERQPKAYGLIKMGNQETNTDGKSSRTKLSPEGHTKSHRHRSRSRSPKRSRSSLERHRLDHGESRSPVKSKPRKPSPKRKLTAEEREKKLAEMMENAKWREEQRKTNIKQYEKEEEKEKEYEKRTRGSGAKFLNPMLSKHASESSIEDRLKRNKYNIQRSKADLEKKFTEK